MSFDRDYHNLVKTIQKEVKKRLKNEATGHDYWHCQRVVKVALQIGKEEHANLSILELAGWLHDIGVKKGRKNHEVRSALWSENFLKKHHVEKKLIERVVECVRHHRFSTGKAETLEDKVLQDADKLDVMGAIGIARLFAFAGRYKRTFHDGKILANTHTYKRTGYSRTALEHYYDKIFLLPTELHTKTAKKIGLKRIQFAKEFVKRFLEEWEGRGMDSKNMTFCDRVYKIVAKIPKGKVATYGQVARLAGNPKAARAVGILMKTNLFAPRVPCHRVVGADGRLVGYSGGKGVETKKSMLRKEGVRFIGDKVDLMKYQWNSGTS